MNRSLVVLISGYGNTLQALIDAQLPAPIAAVISNEPEAFGLIRAQQAGISTQVINHRDFITRDAFDLALQTQIDAYQPQLVILAGFMRKLTPSFVNHYANRLINIHPSLLPAYPGMHTHERVLAAHEKHHGTTVHLVTEELDAGPILGQASCDIHPNDTPDNLKKRVQQLEATLYPNVIRAWLQKHMSD